MPARTVVSSSILSVPAGKWLGGPASAAGGMSITETNLKEDRFEARISIASLQEPRPRNASIEFLLVVFQAKTKLGSGVIRKFRRIFQTVGQCMEGAEP